MKNRVNKIKDLKVGDITTPRKSGRYRGVSIGLDKNGFYVLTHRSRSKSYKTPKKIPNNIIKRIASTG